VIPGRRRETREGHGEKRKRRRERNMGTGRVDKDGGGVGRIDRKEEKPHLIWPHCK
jgi:hypothetical protein